MDLSALEKRIRAVELKSTPLRLNKRSSSGASRHSTNDTITLLRELEELAHEISLIKEEALAAGDHRLALACIREFCRMAELRARLRGEIDQKTITNVLHVHLDADTAKRVAETYLARRRKVESHE